MYYIVLPTDLFPHMQDEELSASQQLVYLSLIINRPINMTGVYVTKRREIFSHISASIPDRKEVFEALEALEKRHLIFYDNDVLFIPLVPEASKLARHNQRYKMNSFVTKLGDERANNRALKAYAKWFATHVSSEKESSNTEKKDHSAAAAASVDYTVAPAKETAAPDRKQSAPPAQPSGLTNSANPAADVSNNDPTAIFNKTHAIYAEGTGKSGQDTSSIFNSSGKEGIFGQADKGGAGENLPDTDYDIFDRESEAGEDEMPNGKPSGVERSRS